MTPLMEHAATHILFCDLSAGACRREPLDPDLARQAPGGRALAVALLAGRPQAAWDAPEAAVVLAPGALAGFDLPGASFAALAGTNPHTGGILSVAVPGGLGRALARLRLAAVVVSGRSDTPTALFLDADGARLTPLGAAAGQGTSAVLAALPAHDGAVVAGPAALASSPLAGLWADGLHPVGPGGVAWLLAAKNCFGVAVRGQGEGPAAADPEGLAGARAAMERLIAAAPALAGPCGFGRYGTAALMDLTAGRRMLPTRHFRETVFEAAGRLSAPGLFARLSPRAAGCPGCPTPCRHVVAEGGVLPDGDAWSHLTALLGLADPDLAVAAHAFCRQAGLFAPGAAVVLAGRAEAAGRDITPDALLPALAGLVAEGAALAPPAMAVKGAALPAFDPRGAYGLALSLAVGPSGPDAWGGLCLGHELLRKPVATDRFSFAGKARAVFLGENAAAVAASLGGCPLYGLAVGLEEWALALSAVRGETVTAADLAGLGQRTVLVERAINARAGLHAADDDLPQRFFVEPGSSGEGIAVPPLPREAFLAARAAYYRLRGLDEAGRPTAEAAALESPWPI